MHIDKIKKEIVKYLKSKNEKINIFENHDAVKVKKLIQEYLNYHKYKSDDLVEQIYNDLFGMGIISTIIANDTITDISYNGRELWVQSNNKGRFKYPVQISKKEAYIIIEKLADNAQKAFNYAHPILDVEYQTIRINAIHESISPIGRNFSIRILKSKNIINQNNFPAPEKVRLFLEKLVKNHQNIVISGQTGSGKSELQKYLIKSIYSQDKIVIIADNNELKIEKLYPEKDVYTWVAKQTTNLKIDFSQLIKPALRFNPEWIIISETRSKEAIDMLNAAATGHNIITTLHAKNARNIPLRILNMCLEGDKNLQEKVIMKNIFENINYGVHLKAKIIKGKIVREIVEICQYNKNGQANLIYTKEKGFILHVKDFKNA